MRKIISNQNSYIKSNYTIFATNFWKWRRPKRKIKRQLHFYETLKKKGTLIQPPLYNCRNIIAWLNDDIRYNTYRCKIAIFVKRFRMDVFPYKTDRQLRHANLTKNALALAFIFFCELLIIWHRVEKQLSISTKNMDIFHHKERHH